MTINSRTVRSVCIAALLLLMATPSFAQSARTSEPILRGNPRRDAGGSCVYNKDGAVVFAPDGKHCSDRSDHLANSLSDSPVVDAFPPAMRQELTRLLGDHEHIAGEVARLTHALDNQNGRAAMDAADKLRSELAAHRAREEKFFATMARERIAR